MIDAMIECKIIDIVPEARYSGTTYTQTVVCQLENGIEIPIFDSTPPIGDEELIYSRINASLLARSKEVLITDSKERKVEPFDGGECTYVGKVVGVEMVGSSNIEVLDVDVGIGRICVEPDGDFEESIGALETVVGEYIESNAYRTDIVDFSPL